MTDALPSTEALSEALDPRVERSRRVILSAALEVLGEMGYGGLTIEGVAARAGVGKSTVYRHWCGKVELVEDAIRSLKTGVAWPTTGPVRERVVDAVRQIARAMEDSTWSTCLPAIIEAARRDPEVMAIHQRLAAERRELLVDLLADGVRSGEVSADADLGVLADCLVGPILLRRLILQEPFDDAAIAQLVDQVLGPAPSG